MTPSKWKTLVETMLDSINSKEAVKAARTISKTAEASHVKELYALLKSDNFFVREAVAEPLARLEGAASLPALFDALEKGEDQGHDNDGLVNTIIGTLEKHKKKAAAFLTGMVKSEKTASRANGVWGMGFILESVDPKIVFDLFTSDPDEEVRLMAGDALHGLNPPKAKELFDTRLLTGKWMWLDCEAHLSYGFEINGLAGTCIKTNSPCFAVGDVILNIHAAHETSFVGQQIFTNGAWYSITALVKDNKLHIQANGLNWAMERVD